LKKQIENLKRENHDIKERKTNGSFRNNLLNSVENVDIENVLGMQEVIKKINKHEILKFRI